MPSVTEKSLVLVVGAGASKEANLPVGTELKQQIASALDIRYDDFGLRRISGDNIINEAFQHHATATDSSRADINPYLHSAWRIRDAMPQAISIDNFIDSHRDEEKIAFCGKLAIARCILAAEVDSALQIDRRNGYNKINFSALGDTWYNAFFQILTENCQQADLPESLSKIAIICFNYDRCIEHYLYWAIQNYYGMGPAGAADALSNLEIYHPYGTVGELPWQSQEQGIEFGSTPRGLQLLTLAGKLRTFTEGIDPTTSKISAIRSTLREAHRIAFLGFAFHRLNVQFLFPGLEDRSRLDGCPIYATAYGISSADVQAISEELSSVGGFDRRRIYLRNDLQCSQLFREFGRGLSIQ
jgi:hypothetical protein